MTARVVLSCERQWSEGQCPEQIHVTDVATVVEARTVAARYGWHNSASGERCPAHATGDRAAVNPYIVSARGVSR